MTSWQAYGGARLCLGEARLTKGVERARWLEKARGWRDLARLIRKRERREREAA